MNILCLMGRHRRSRAQAWHDREGRLACKCARCHRKMVYDRVADRWQVTDRSEHHEPAA